MVVDHSMRSKAAAAAVVQAELANVQFGTLSKKNSGHIGAPRLPTMTAIRLIANLRFLKCLNDNWIRRVS